MNNSICPICNQPITEKDLELGNFNESLDMVIHQSCYDALEDDYPDVVE